MFFFLCWLFRLKQLTTLFFYAFSYYFFSNIFNRKRNNYRFSFSQIFSVNSSSFNFSVFNWHSPLELFFLLNYYYFTLIKFNETKWKLKKFVNKDKFQKWRKFSLSFFFQLQLFFSGIRCGFMRWGFAK